MTALAPPLIDARPYTRFTVEALERLLTGARWAVDEAYARNDGDTLMAAVKLSAQVQVELRRRENAGEGARK